MTGEKKRDDTGAEARHRGRLRYVPRSLRPLVRPPLDLARRTLVRLRGLSLRPARFLATGRFVRQSIHEIRRRRTDPRLKVGVDASALWESLRGVGWYLLRVVESLAEQPGVSLRLYGPSLLTHRDAQRPVEPLPEGDAIEVVAFEVRDPLIVPAGLLAKLFRVLEGWLVRLDRNDVLFEPNFVFPRRYSLDRAPRVNVVHDLSLFVVPETMQVETRETQRQQLARNIERAAWILTDAETVRQEIVERGLKGGERVRAVHLAASHSRAVPDDSIIERLELAGGFVLHVGTLEPRKNIATLVEAWRGLPSRGDGFPPLVVCGGSGWNSEELEREIEAEVTAGKLVRPGYVSAEELAALYEHAALVVSASRYEGFGLPLVEAMELGKALVLSDIPVYREVAGAAAEYVDPLDAQAWAQAVRRLVADRDRVQSLERLALERAREFSWERAGLQTLDVLRRAAKGPDS